MKRNGSGRRHEWSEVGVLGDGANNLERLLEPPGEMSSSIHAGSLASFQNVCHSHHQALRREEATSHRRPSSGVPQPEM